MCHSNYGVFGVLSWHEAPKHDLCRVLERGACVPCFSLRSRSCSCSDCLQTSDHWYDATNDADPGEIAAERVTQTHASASSCVAQPGSPLASGAVTLSIIMFPSTMLLSPLRLLSTPKYPIHVAHRPLPPTVRFPHYSVNNHGDLSVLYSRVPTNPASFYSQSSSPS